MSFWVGMFFFPNFPSQTWEQGPSEELTVGYSAHSVPTWALLTLGGPLPERGEGLAASLDSAPWRPAAAPQA